MSGIEIAGLVLGALPLFISAAEHYRDCLGAGRRVLRKKEFAEQYHSEVIVQRTLLSCYIKAVVARTRLSASLQLQLVDSPLAHDWQMPEVVKELSRELGDSYKPVVALISSICQTFAKQIRHDDKGLRPCTDSELVDSLRALSLDATHASSNQQEDIWNKIKFSWKHYKREAILDELKSYNISLRQLEDAVQLAKPFERRQQFSKAHATFQLRSDTEKLYQAIRKACNCQPCKQRDVALGLAAHCHNLGESVDLSFQLLFFDAHGRVCVTLVALEHTDAPQTAKKKKVRVGFPTLQLPNQSGNKLQKIQDICTVTAANPQNKSGMHLVVNEKGELCVKQSSPSGKIKNDGLLSSLSDLLADLKLYDHKRWLIKEKAILAVILAYSLLQLHESSWWQSAWNSKNISFLGVGAASSQLPANPDQRLKLRGPFTRSMVCDESASPSPSPTSSRNGHLHEFGIVLLELHLSRSIQPDIDADPGANPCFVAQRLLQESSDDITMTKSYMQAVRFCLFPSPNPCSGSFSFKDKGFREIFYAEVIEMLEDHLSDKCESTEQVWTGAWD